MNCPNIFARSGSDDHNYECLGFIEKCSYCESKMRRCELDNHVRFDCLENEISCILCYTEGIKKKEMDNHK